MKVVIKVTIHIMGKEKMTFKKNIKLMIFVLQSNLTFLKVLTLGNQTKRKNFLKNVIEWNYFRRKNNINPFTNQLMILCKIYISNLLK